MEWYYEMSRQTGNDYFILPPSGYLYSYPSSLAADVQDLYVSATEEAAVLLSVATLLDGTFFTIADGTGTGPRAHS
jgi:hypothetical protein